MLIICNKSSAKKAACILNTFFNYLFTASKKDYDLFPKVTSQKREEHVDLLVQLTHHVVLFQSTRSTAEKIIS